MISNIETKFKETEIGTLPEEWDILPLGEVAESISDTFKFNGDEVVFLNTGDILEGKILNHNLFNPDLLPGQAKKRIKKDDILFSEIRPANKRFAYIDFDGSDYVVSTKLMVIRAKSSILPKYLYVVLTSPEMLNTFQVLAESRSGTFPQITFEAISSTPLPLPNIVEQERLSEFILTLDEKIELNRQINSNLEKLASALFKHWFVDFEFPDNDGKPYKSSGGKMVDSELGEIPVGWKVVQLNELADVIDCLHSKKPKRLEENTDNVLLQLDNVKDDGLLDLTTKYYICDADYKKWISRIEASEGDCIITNVGRVGAFSRIPANIKAALGRNMTGIRCKLSFPYHFYLAQYFLSDLYKSEVSKNMDVGTILDALNVKNIPKLRLLFPPKQILDMANNIFESIWKLREQNKLSNYYLSDARNYLLPRLMSGKIRVNNL